MCEFEKWWKDSPSSWKCNLGRSRAIAIATWKAALEWILGEMNDKWGADIAGGVGWLEGFIREELGHEEVIK